MKRNLFVFLSLIVIIASLLRFVGLSSNPPSLTWDEAAWGYNAYSLGIDGKDEFGKFLPLAYIESFGDFKPPLYAYLSVLPVKIFGLNEFSTRFISALFGVLTVFLTYFLVKKIFSKINEAIALLSAAILAISPWHILLSRAAFEANVASFFIVLGVYLFLISLERKKFLVLSVLSFVASMYTFNTARIVSPLLLFGLFFMNWRYFLKVEKKELIISAVVGVIVFFPLFLFLLTPQAKLRFEEVNIFSDGAVVERANQQIENDNNSDFSKIIHNRRVGYAIEYVRHYFDNLTPEFLFVRGDGNPKFSIQDVGQLYLVELPFFIAGIFMLFRKRDGHWWIIPFWLMVGILPAATARETPHALRIESTLPTFQIFTAIGIYFVSQILFGFKKRILNVKVGTLISLFLMLMLSLNVYYFLHSYSSHYPKSYSSEWQYGYKQVIEFIKVNNSKFEKIIFTEDLGRPYIYALFYLKYSPEKFRNNAEVAREALGFVHVNSFDKYSFEKVVSSKHDSSKNYLYIDKPNKVPENATLLATFRELDGKATLAAYSL